jgi:hypothetical protein
MSNNDHLVMNIYYEFKLR